mgnify:CR=1 FL=1
MSSKQAPLRNNVAMLNSLRALEMLEGDKNKVIEIQGQFSRNIQTNEIPYTSPFIKEHWHNLSELYAIRWKAKGDDNAQTVSEILKSLEKEACPDIFLKSITIIKPWMTYDNSTMEKREINVTFIFHPHPFKPSVFNRLKGRMPSFALYSRMKEIRKILLN